jgi:CRISPR-associated endonuclease Csn1
MMFHNGIILIVNCFFCPAKLVNSYLFANYFTKFVKIVLFTLMKRVLGLDLGTTSIGWALVEQAETRDEKSSIIKAGVRVNPLTTDEKDSFEKGKAITTNADRRLKRGMRRNLQRYKLRREHLISILRRVGWVSEETLFSEQGAASTYQTFRLRAEAPEKEISLEELSKVLLMINRKRGYKSNRLADNAEEGHLVDGMSVARELYEEGLTPAQYSLRLMAKGVRMMPDYYRSDLTAEFERVWKTQSEFWPEILTEDFKKSIELDGKSNVTKKFLAKFGIYTADNKGSEKKKNALQWRVDALTEKLEKETLAYVIADIKGEIQGSSGYLGAISDRSKELVFSKKTVGQYLYGHILENPNYSTKNQVFYRQDYLDEFERIWECQKQFHPELTEALKSEIRDTVIFYQRRLRSQKNLISKCEFENSCRVAPRSSLLFQEFKIWTVVNNILIKSKDTGESRPLSMEEKSRLVDVLMLREKVKPDEILKMFTTKPRGYELNYGKDKAIQGNLTMSALFGKFLEIVAASGHGEYSLGKTSPKEVRRILEDIFKGLGFNAEVLKYDSSLPKEEYERQPLFKLWHLLYSYEGDNSATGDESLVRRISEICGMPPEYSRLLTSVRFVKDYASLSHKAMRKILPHLKEGETYDVACSLAGYNHSSSVTREENESRVLKDRLQVLPKGALRNPVVEKILNQMVNVVNMVGDEYGRPDEIHIEMARSLKQNAAQREKATQDIGARTKQNEEIKKKLQTEFHLSYVSSNDILRYRLYEELQPNGYKTLYSGKYIPRDMLFSKGIDIEHIIPQALMFDDSYANKTLEFSDVNREKGSDTAVDYVVRKYGEDGKNEYKTLVDDLLYVRNAISRRKHDYLLMTRSEIPSDFVNRDLTNTQYIAKKATEILNEYVRTVVPTSGKITELLREQWNLVDVMKELNLPKYRQAGKTYDVDRMDGGHIEKIKDWTKRNDHRHHAMDAITIAFTRREHIQVLNTLNAREGSEDYSLKEKMTVRVGEHNKKILVPPMPLNELRPAFRKALESTLVSIKAKNKVTSKAINKIRKAGGEVQKVGSLTPRGQLHKEQVYGRRKVYETFEMPVGSKMTPDKIALVASKAERLALARRLEEFGGDVKKAFTGKNSLDKNPIYVDAAGSITLPAKVKCVQFKTVYTIRKDVGPGLSLDKVVDGRVKKLLQERLDQFGGDQAKAFANLDENPIWVDEAKGIRLRKVTIAENLDLCAIRNKRDKDGELVLDKQGKPIPNDFVNLRNNHHVAIYRDADGNFQENIVTFMVALQRKTSGVPVVDRDYNKDLGWSFVFSMKINEMFVFPNPATGFDPQDIDLMDPANYKEISENLFRVQKLSSKYYVFRHHLETTLEDTAELKDVTWKRITCLANLQGVVKVRIDHLGRIVQVGEY